MKKPECSIIIPVLNDADRLNRCLDALSKQSFQAPFEVVVVDNNSTEDILSVVLQYPFAEYRKETTPGSYAARNRGIRYARGTYLAFTDADCIPESDWLKQGIEFLETHRQCEIAGGRIQLTIRNRRPNGVELFDQIYAFRQKKSIEEHGYSVTANLFMRRGIIDKTGPFDESLMSGGDHEWCRRAVSLGYNLGYCNQAVVRHPARCSARQFMSKYIRVAEGIYMINNYSSYQLLRITYHNLLSLGRNIRRLNRHNVVAARTDKIKVMYYFTLKILIYHAVFLKNHLLRSKSDSK